MLNQLQKQEKDQENYRVLSAIAASLPPTETRALLLSSSQNSSGINGSDVAVNSTITQSSNEKTKKRHTNPEAQNDVEPSSKKKKN